jgi:hypothetical protein
MYTFTQKCLFCIMPLFQESIVKKYLSTIDEELIEKAFNEFKRVYSADKIKNIKIAKEEQYQEGFIKDIFGQVLGYSVFPEQPFNIQTEKKNQVDSKKADGAIFKEENVVGVIELKDNKTKNLDAVKDQAFGYKNNHKYCSYVISSNFHKLRFYVDDATDYEEFDLYNLDKEAFRRFYLYLRKEGLLDKNIPKLLRQETKFHEENITKKLYKDYSSFKKSFFQNVVKNNPQHNKLILFKKSQKFLDKVLFVLFAEDKGLITTNSIVKIVEKWHDLKSDAFDTPKPLYQLVSRFFNNLFVGKKDQDGCVLIPEFGGEIFAPDEVLDTLIVDDVVLKDDLLKLSKYDFNTEVDVNILGHIFEHSLSEIEEVEAELREEIADKNKGKRKKDGVFYTPKFITKYIVENTVGKLCLEKKEQLKLNIEVDIIEYQKIDGKLNSRGIIFYEALNQYKSWLLSLKILDPACGSGAFLNQVLNFLIEEHKFVDDLIAELTNTPLRLFDTDLAILENNIYGVDINEESIEIAKLSLWLRTAKQERRLSNLSNNIKCGNSLVDDSTIAGVKAFNWKTEFTEVITKGGFDIVLGNPPYVLCQPSNTIDKLLQEYKKYQVASYKIDLFHLFFEKSIQLLKKGGYLGFITPNTYLTNKYVTPLRKYILDNTSVINLVLHNESIFSDASVDVASIIIKKEKINDNQIKISTTKENQIVQLIVKKQFSWENDPNKIFNANSQFNFSFQNFIKLGEICDTYFGIQAYDRKSSISEQKKDNNYLEIIDGEDILPFVYATPRKYFNYIQQNIKSGGDWNVYSRERIVVRQIGQVPIVGLCKGGILGSNTLYSIYPKNDNFSLLYLLAILNSTLIKKYWSSMYSDGKSLFPKIKGFQLKELPIFPASKELQNKFESLAGRRNSISESILESQLFFVEFLKSKYVDLKRNLFDWNNKEFSYILKELKKNNIRISIEDEAELMKLFLKYKFEINNLSIGAMKLDKEIDKLIYNTYGIEDIADTN